MNEGNTRKIITILIITVILISLIILQQEREYRRAKELFDLCVKVHGFESCYIIMDR